MFCAKCGNNLSDGARFCPKCGTTVNISAGESSPANSSTSNSSASKPKSAAAVKDKPQKRQGKKTLPLIAALAAVVVLIAAAVYKLWPSPADAPAAQDPNMVLLAIIDDVEARHKKAMEECEKQRELMAESESGEENLRNWCESVDGFLVELDELRREADAISGLDAKLASAKDAYFDMLRDSRAAYSKTITFFADYIEFYVKTVLDYRPIEVDFDDPSEYSQALSAWLQEARECYASISYPSTVASEWERYGVVLEYNADILEKIEQAVQYGDLLRLYSARNLTERYDKAETAQYQKIYGCLEAETKFADSQYAIATRLREEMYAYAEMTPEERDTYEFEYIRTGKISLNYDVVDTIYPSLYNTYDAFVILKTGCASGTRNIVVEAEIEGFTQKYQQSFRLDSSYQAIYIKPPALTGELNLTTAKPAQLKITVSDQDGTLIETQTFDVTIKSKNDFAWYSDEYGEATQDNILSFLTPEASAVTALKRQAIDEISAMTNGEIESFVGYQNLSPNQYWVTYLQTAGLMSALHSMGVRYNMDPFSLGGSDQHILLPEDVIEQRSGLCVETSLVIASALQSANMHAFLIFPPGHAQVAVEVWNSGSHQGEYFLIETTALDSRNSIDTFVQAANALAEGQPPSGIITQYDQAQWAEYLEGVEYIVDCNDSQLLGLTPFVN